ncbi:hypothetical protein DYI26_19415 [Halomonas litopenaei]|nr:hypothetical protein [Halomonas litopenaei]
MKLKPHEILQKLGFDIGEDGIEINPNDAYLYDSMLGLVGATISVKGIPDADLISQRRTCGFLADMPVSEPGPEDLDKARMYLSTILKQRMGFVERK